MNPPLSPFEGAKTATPADPPAAWFHRPPDRVRRPERMDDPALDRDEHIQALGALATVNRVSLAARRVWADVARLAEPGRPVRVLDVACGGGDVLAAVRRKARRRGVEVELHGCDASPVALEVARGVVGSDASTAFFRLDVLSDPLPSGYDLVCSSLFLHHLADAAAARLLSAMAAATRRTLLVQDLRRTRRGHVLAWLGLHTLTRSPVARDDGLVSVRAAFTIDEARRLCAAAGLVGASVRPGWPQRFILRWSRT